MQEVFKILKEENFNREKWVNFLKYVVKGNNFQQLPLDVIYELKLLFLPHLPEKYHKNCRLRLKDTDEAIKYRVTKEKDGFELRIKKETIGYIYFSNYSGSFSYSETQGEYDDGLGELYMMCFDMYD